ncbi:MULTISPECIES: carbon storage regulator [unclassified Pseudomonas]|uniref:carbon storage regulator n=1 Tax=unclassified Pseudomonas TaxID=196821 RepID=UPI000A1D78D8|nr:MULTISPECIES: carbon storage regulator [unclassified Pseudomonas]
MLVFSRKLGEMMVIGEDITITIAQVDERRGQVRLGVEAPPTVLVHREEVYAQLRKSKAIKTSITIKRKKKLIQ